jgi:hypothetical protein
MKSTGSWPNGQADMPGGTATPAAV